MSNCVNVFGVHGLAAWLEEDSFDMHASAELLMGADDIPSFGCLICVVFVTRQTRDR